LVASPLTGMTIALKLKHSAAVIADSKAPVLFLTNGADSKAPVLFLTNGMVAPLDDVCDCKGRR
jgi:hypothetical protein